MKILLADDSASVTGPLLALFEPYGVAPTVVASLADALSALAQGDYDAVVLDLSIAGPVVDADYVVGAIRAATLGRVILASGIETGVLNRLALRYGCLALQKPYSFDKLWSCLETPSSAADGRRTGGVP